MFSKEKYKSIGTKKITIDLTALVKWPKLQRSKQLIMNVCIGLVERPKMMAECNVSVIASRLIGLCVDHCYLLYSSYKHKPSALRERERESPSEKLPRASECHAHNLHLWMCSAICKFN